MKIERLYSDYDEYYDEKLYSTGNDELDELMEKAFCDGYEYAQREFARARQRKKNAKKAVGVVNDVVEGNMTVSEANKALGKIQARQGSGKVLDIRKPMGAIESIRDEEGRPTQDMRQVTVKAQKSSRQARHIAEGIGNGNPTQTAELTQKLDKNLIGTTTSKGNLAGIGVSAEKHTMNGGFEAKKQQRVEPSQVRKAQMEKRANERTLRNKQRSEIRTRQKQEAEQRRAQRLADEQKKKELDAQKQAKHVSDSKAYQASKPKPTPTSTPKPNTTSTPKPTSTPTSTPKPNTTQTSKLGEGWLKKNWNKLGTGGKIAAVAIPTTAAAIGTGMASKKRKNRQTQVEGEY